MVEWLVHETQSLLIAVDRRSSPRPSRFFAKSRLFFYFFLLRYLETLFVMFSLVFAKRSFASVSKICLSSKKMSS